MSRSRPRSTLAFLLLAAMGCGETQSVPDDVVERVENGVAIVENPGFALADTVSWRLDTVNVVRIGTIDGPDEYVIGRLAGIQRRPGGAILLADELAGELRLFDEDGRFIRRIGRRGQGPGEFSSVGGLLPYSGDSLLVPMSGGNAGTILDPELRHARSYQVRLPETRARYPMTSHRMDLAFADGRFLVGDYIDPCGTARAAGFCEDSVAFFRTDGERAAAAFYGQFVYERTESNRVGPGLTTSWREPHPQAFWTVHGDRFYYGDARRFEIQVFAADGRLERLIRVLTDAPRYARQEVFPPMAADYPPGTREAEAMRVLREAQAVAVLPDSFPHFSDLLVDETGNVWVREYLPPGRQTSVRPRWFVFDPTGRLTQILRSPPGMIRHAGPLARVRPQIGADYVLGFVRDELGVESVVLYRLEKS